MKKILLLLLPLLIMTGCSLSPKESPEQIKQVETTKTQPLLFIPEINQSLKTRATVEETTNPELTFPADVHAGQVNKYFKLGNIFFALALQNTMNVTPPVPQDFSPSFVGVLVAKQGDTTWSKWLEIKDYKTSEGNNPYYLTVKDKKLLLTVVDHNGAGSGEGIMKVLTLSEAGDWKLDSCYYFGLKYNDPVSSGDYFAFSIDFSKQMKEPKSSCSNLQLVFYEQVPGPSCSHHSDCATPMEYLTQSNCPFTSACVANFCRVACPLYSHDPNPDVSKSHAVQCKADSDCNCSERADKTLECRCVDNKCMSIEK